MLAARPEPAPTRDSIPVVPLRDRIALAAHADSAGVAHAVAFSLAWMETRTGACLPHCPRGPGVVRIDSVVAGHVYAHRICREIGRMQINPCAGLERHNPRCERVRVLTSIDDNYACGLWFYATLAMRYRGDTRRALSAYNGGRASYATQALAMVGQWWLSGELSPGDRGGNP